MKKRDIWGSLAVAVFGALFFAVAGCNSQTYAESNRDFFEKAFQEVAYAYYMRGDSLQYNVAKGTVESPEEATPQDNNYLACAFYVTNVYDELMGLTLSHGGGHYGYYARRYIGNRPEVIGYGKLQGSDLLWYDGSKDGAGTLTYIENPSQDYIISQLKIGDILFYTGHVMLVYDYVYGPSGEVTDVYLLNSTVTGNYYTRTKTDIASSALHYYDSSNTKVSMLTTYAPWSKLFYINHDMSGVFDESISNEGTVQLETLKYRAENINHSLLFDKTNPDNNYQPMYSILRFVQEDESGNGLLSFDGSVYFGGEVINGQAIEYSDSVKSRLKYSKLYIEKTVDKRDNNTVSEGDELTYQIIVKNNSTQNYTDDLVVRENISDYVDYISSTSTKSGVVAQRDGGQLSWNVGKLSAGEEVTIRYVVKVKSGTRGSVIESTGFVAGIPSGVVKNKVGKNLDAEQAGLIKEKYDELKSEYSSKELINQIYDQALGWDLGLNDFNISAASEDDEDGLVYYNNEWGNWGKWGDNSLYMSLSKNNRFSNMVLNGYFNVLYKDPATYGPTNDGKYVIMRSLAGWGDETKNPDNRANTIFPEDFQTGDVLIYSNTDDKSYYYDNSDPEHIKEWVVTRENGDYYYIYIEGEGFVGVNTGSDAASSRDDRNEFSSTYFDADHQNIKMIQKGSNTTSDMTDPDTIEWMHYQSMFGKDSYVVLRPSLLLSEDDDVNIASPKTADNVSIYIICVLVSLALVVPLSFIMQRKR